MGYIESLNLLYGMYEIEFTTFDIFNILYCDFMSLLVIVILLPPLGLIVTTVTLQDGFTVFS